MRRNALFSQSSSPIEGCTAANGLLDAENLTKVLEVALVLAHALLRRIGDFRHGLTVAGHHFDDDVERLRTAVVHEIRADTESQAYAAVKAPEEFKDSRHRERI